LREEEIMETKPIEKELLDLERRYWQALKDGNFEAAAKLTDDPAIVAGAQGVAQLDRKSIVAMMQTDAYKLNSFELSDDVKVNKIADDVAVIAYKVHEELTVDGKPVTLDAADSSTWVRRNGQWLCALHTESITGDPFGRDRRPA
jgi:hypothetical protein